MERSHDQALALLESVLMFRLGQHRSPEEPVGEPELDETLQRFEHRYGRLRWLHGTSRGKTLFLSKLSDLLRHHSPSQALARGVVEEAIDHGIDQVLAGTSQQSRRFLERAKEVRESFHKTLSTTLLLPDGANLTTYLDTEHQIADILAIALAKRHRRDVLVVTSRDCYQVSRGQLFKVTDPNLCRQLRHRALQLGEAERYWQQAAAKAPTRA
jgi:hypothetical protein